MSKLDTLKTIFLVDDKVVLSLDGGFAAKTVSVTKKKYLSYGFAGRLGTIVELVILLFVCVVALLVFDVVTPAKTLHTLQHQSVASKVFVPALYLMVNWIVIVNLVQVRGLFWAIKNFTASKR